MAASRTSFWLSVPGQMAGTAYYFNVSVIETHNLAGDSPLVQFGFPVKKIEENGQVYLTAYVSGDNPNLIFGFVARNPYGLGPESPLANMFNAGYQIQDIPVGIMVRGYMNVDYTSTGTPLLGNQVYINNTGTDSASGIVPVGTVGDGSDSANYAALTGAYFATNGVDAFSVAQIRFHVNF